MNTADMRFKTKITCIPKSDTQIKEAVENSGLSNPALIALLYSSGKTMEYHVDNNTEPDGGLLHVRCSIYDIPAQLVCCQTTDSISAADAIAADLCQIPDNLLWLFNYAEMWSSKKSTQKNAHILIVKAHTPQWKEPPQDTSKLLLNEAVSKNLTESINFAISYLQSSLSGWCLHGVALYTINSFVTNPEYFALKTAGKKCASNTPFLQSIRSPLDSSCVSGILSTQKQKANRYLFSYRCESPASLFLKSTAVVLCNPDWDIPAAHTPCGLIRTQLLE